MKTTELTGAQLDFWVAKAQGFDAEIVVDEKGAFCVKTERFENGGHSRGPYFPSSAWHEGGPLIEREQMTITSPGSRVHRNGGPNAGWGSSGLWGACTWHAGANGRRSIAHHESSPLVAAMRCFVQSKFGEEVADTTG